MINSGQGNEKIPCRILCVFAELNRGGAETMCMNLYRNIDRERIQFDFVKHTSDKGAYEEEILSLGGKIYTAPRFGVLNIVKYCAWWKKHFEQHPEHRVVHGHYFTISAVYFVIAKKERRITVGHSHSTEPRHKTIRTILKALMQSRIENFSDYCLACSNDAGKWLFPRRDYIVLNNAINAADFCFNEKTREAIRANMGIKDTTFIVGVTGSFSPVKNPFGTIEIFKAVHERNPSARLLWVGDGGMRSEIERKLRDEKLTDVVIMTGVRSDVDRLMQAMDVFILPSLFEGLPVVLMEAQAAGLPCFISDAVTEEAAITDLCTFLPLGEPEQWADAILSADLSGRRDTSREIRDAGYDIKTTAKWLEEFYLNCLK